jgi:hypothetical protein
MDKRAAAILAAYIEGEITPETLINLWTLQQPGAVEQLQKAGRLAGDPAFAFSIMYDRLGKSTAYFWMNEQMQRRSIPTGNYAVPIWAFLLPPVIDQNWECRPGDCLIHLRVPMRRVLLSIHTAWVKLLSVSDHLNTEYLCVNEEDRLAHQARNNIIPDAHTCRKSWEKMFEIGLIGTPGFNWPKTLQATIAEVLAEDVLDIIVSAPGGSNK